MLLKIGKNILEKELIEYCGNHSRRWVIISDTHVNQLLGEKLNFLNVEIITFPAGEQFKTRETKQKLEDTLLEKGYGRDTGFIAMGGGVVTDLVGFLASTYCRGVPVIYVPTTLLGMVDASIGGKTGVNTPQGKNLVGTFYPPDAVFMDIDLLDTLPEKEWRNGIVETLKHGLIADAELLDLLEDNHNIEMLIKKSVAVKLNIIQQDFHEKNMRQLLNFGHTVGHAIETIENYNITHGEAVAIGLLMEAYLSYLSGFLNYAVIEKMIHILQLYHLPLKTTAFEDLIYFKKVMGLDKKAKKNIPHFVLLDDIGKPHQDNDQYTFSVDDTLFDETLNWFMRNIKNAC